MAGDVNSLQFALHLRSQMLELCGEAQDDEHAKLVPSIIKLCASINIMTSPKQEEYDRAVLQG